MSLEAPESTVLEAEPLGGPSGGGAPRTLPAETLRDAVAAEMNADGEAQAEKPDDKPEADKPEKGAEKPDADAKPAEAKDDKKPADRAPDGKFAAKQADGDDAKPDVDAEPAAKGEDAAEKPKANGHIEPPAKFLPDAKETWRNTPRPVQRDIDNLVRQHETELTRHREASERYEPLRQFDEHVRQNGRAGLHETLAEVAQLEDQMGKNPVAAINQILMRVGPRKPDGQPVSLFELASAVVKMGPQGYQQAVTQQAPQQQQRQPDPEVQQLKQQLSQMQEQQTTATIIEPFKREHPRYDELKADIALFLQSGKIPTSLSPHDRLAAAYDMAVRINPTSHAEAPAADADPEPGGRAAPDLSGSKSIKSAPGAVSAEMEPERGGSISDLLRDEMKRAKRS